MTSVSQLRAANLGSVAAQDAADPADELRMDETAFRACYQQSAPRLFAYLLRVSGDHALAEDLLQETYIRFLAAKLPAMNDSQRRSYLFRIASNLLRDRWRRQKEIPLPDSLPETSSNDPQFERKLATRQAFEQLKLRERQLLWLAYVEGSSHKEIAEAMGLRASSIRLLLFRARHKLAALIRAGNCLPERLK